jgi:hypothetical protein
MDRQYTTGLEDDKFEKLLAAVTEIMEQEGKRTESHGRGRPPALDLSGQVELTLVLLRTNITQEAAGALFGVSQPTVSKTKPPATSKAD